MTGSVPEVERPALWVLDSSAAINFKRLALIPLVEQWDFWSLLLTLVESRGLVFPIQVRDELAQARYPDMPGAWALRAWNGMPAHDAPDNRSVAEVERRHPQLVERASDPDDPAPASADVYVVALALNHQNGGDAVAVIADDQGVRAACDGFSVPVVGASEFVARVFPRARA